MATAAEFEKAFGEVRDATTKIAERIEKLTSQIGNGGLSSDEEAKVLAELQQAADALKAMGNDVANPVPLPPDTPV